MNNRPYNPETLTPLETLLLKRVEMLETVFVQVIRSVADQLPSTRESLFQLGQVASQHTQQAEESSARLYLESLGQNEHPLKEGGLSTLGLVETHLPTLYGIPHLLSLTVNNLFHTDFSQSDLEEIPNNETMLVQMTEIATKPGFYKTTFFREEPALTAIIPLKSNSDKLRQWFALDPELRQWSIIALDQVTSHFFSHHQEGFFDISEVEAGFKKLCFPTKKSKTLPLFKEDEALDTTIPVLLTRIFDNRVVKDGKAKSDHWTISYLVAHPQEQKHVLEIHRVDQKAIPIAFISDGEQTPKSFYLVNTSNPSQQLQQVPLNALSTLSKHLLKDMLQEILHDLKPVKATAKKATKKKSKK